MWLINTITLKLEEFPTEAGLDYAILSHRWGDDEVLFKDLNGSKDLNLLQNKQGFSKVKRCCEQASRDKYSWAWVDTCCIDKSSSAELSEAINSMFHWYRQSSMCYAYLSDVDSLDDIGGSEWFKRGWTLQELLAPNHVQFFGQDWTFLSDKQSLRNELGAITSIPEEALLNFRSEDYCVADKMSWAVGRQTTREEDLAYCLMGLFDINMPLLYGERTKAFLRLQEMIMEYSTDLSIFLWNGQPWTEFGLLAASPSCFCIKSPYTPWQGLRDMFSLPKGWTRNNAGVSIRLSLRPHYIDEDQKAVFVAVIHEPYRYRLSGFGIFLERLERSCQKNDYRRVSVDNHTTIDLAAFIRRPLYDPFSEFTTDLLIAREPMIPSSSAGSSSFIVRWKAPEPLEARVCQRCSDHVEASLEHWPVIASELATTRELCFNYLRIEAKGILGYLLVNISDSLRLLVCFGFDVRFQPLCIVAICDEQLYNKGIKAWNVMHAYYNMFGNREEDTEAFDRAISIYAARASDDLIEFAIFDDTIHLSLDIDTVELHVVSRFLEEQRGRRSPHRADTLKQQRDLFCM
ncbi:heterokaryon incompatibility protein-domain-containing protein [Leptodontidium sp. MPI-SDFR-AT-0119]|nr:heterokaryon incompatibility protein-domain-containing protein [Leptodontidium sp. MPI-SDFR-AT-0119]